MTIQTQLCDRLGIDYPIVQAPIGSGTCPELAAAVSDAGALGQLAVTWQDREETRRVIDRTRTLTDEPFAVNLVCDERTGRIPTADHLSVVLDAGADIVSFSFGEAAPFVEQAHEAGATVCQTVGSAEEARQAVSAGVDIVVTQGSEAGGHLQSEVTTMALVPRVVDAVGDSVSVVAAGGIADGRGIAAALALGADGAWLGTRFLGAEEAAIHERYRQRVTQRPETETCRTTLFNKGWPERSHRVLENETIRRWEAAGRPPPGERPGETDVVAETESGEPLERYSEALATPEVSGDIEAMALFAGQSVGLVGECQPAGDIVAELTTEVAAVIGRLDGGP